MRNFGKKWLMLAAVACSSAFAAIQASEIASEEGAHEVQGMLIEGAYEPGGRSWFALWNPDVRYVFDPGPASDDLWMLVERAGDNFRSVTVWYDAASGRLSEPEGVVAYPVCAVMLDEVRIEVQKSCGSASEGIEGRTSAEGALALGLAELHENDARSARQWLDRALAAQPASPDLKRIALRARAEAFGQIAYEEEPWSEDADRARIAALADYRELARLVPDDVEVRFAIGAALEELGDYAGAEAAYKAVLERWRGESYRVAVRLGAIYRRQGDNERALEQLDQLIAREGPQDGMRLHYHRGWTLTRLGRFDEAVAAFDAGLQFQPDYSWAYIRRACAKASAGRLSEALEDFELGKPLLAGIPGAELPVITHDLRRIEVIERELRSLVAAGKNEPYPQACDGFWGRDDEMRSLSPLLTRTI